MDAKLYLAIEQAENERSDAEDFAQVISKLTGHSATAYALIDAYRNAILNAEFMWREIEQSAGFKAKYENRRDATIDYYHYAQHVDDEK